MVSKEFEPKKEIENKQNENGVLFIDGYLDEINNQLEESTLLGRYNLSLEPFCSVEKTVDLVKSSKPKIIVIGYGLGDMNITGVDIVKSLRQNGYEGHIITNSNGRAEQFDEVKDEIIGHANKKPDELKKIIENIFNDKGPNARMTKEESEARDEKEDSLEEAIECGLIDQAIAIIQTAKNEVEAENFVRLVFLNNFKNNNYNPDLAKVSLETFLSCHINQKERHHHWVHSLSHIDCYLWHYRLDEWIKKFNQVAFKGANELDDSPCCERLIESFVIDSKWNDNPADFSITSENIKWMEKQKYRSEDLTKIQARIKAGRFTTEEDFIEWKNRSPLSKGD